MACNPVRNTALPASAGPAPRKRLQSQRELSAAEVQPASAAKKHHTEPTPRQRRKELAVEQSNKLAAYLGVLEDMGAKLPWDAEDFYDPTIETRTATEDSEYEKWRSTSCWNSFGANPRMTPVISEFSALSEPSVFFFFFFFFFMALVQWRKFQFFDREVVRELEESSGLPSKDASAAGKQDANKDRDPSAPQTPVPATLQSMNISACTSGHGNLVFGDTDGLVHFVDRSYRITSFRAYEFQVTRLKQMKQQNILVTVGIDEETGGQPPVIKVWNVDKFDKTGSPTLVKSMRPLHNNRAYMVSSIAVLDNLSQMAVGLVNGVVLLYRGDITRDRFSRTKVLHEDTVPITGLGFRQTGANVTLFVATSAAIFAYSTTGRERREVLDDNGVELNCTTVSEPEGDFVVARNEAVYFFEVEDRGPAFAFEGPKRLVSWFRNYLIVVTSPQTNAPPVSGSTAGSAVAASASTMRPSLSRVNTVSIYDVKNKFIAFQATFNDVIDVVNEWGAIYVLTAEKKVFILEEKDTQSKLEILFKKNLYQVAISLANSQNYDYDSIIEIFTQFGDHLYGKGDYDNAIAQYIRTIGSLEPSYVIRKFLDAQRIHNLTSYLQALHEHGLANADHTTLLLNCYTKLKDVKKLDDFIKTAKEGNFEVETAIKVCRQAGYHQHALYLARKHQRHEWYLRIQLENIRNYEDGLEYISTLEFAEAEKTLKDYGRILVNNLPEKTTNLLISLCTDYKPRHSVDHVPAAPAPAPAVKHRARHIDAEMDPLPIDMSSLSPEDRDRALLFGPPRKTAAATPSPMPPQQEDDMLAMSSGSGGYMSSTPSKIARAKPEEFIHIYVNQMSWLMFFLEQIIDKISDASPLVYNTLLELYLKDSRDPSLTPVLKARREQAALDLLMRPGETYDLDHAMVLAQMYKFKEGILCLYERAKLFQQIVQYYMEVGDTTRILQTCKKYGKQDPNVWIQVLSHFASREEDCRAEIVEILSNIDKGNLLPPLLVVQILGQNSTATLSIIKDYVTRRLTSENQYIQEDERLIRQYRDETTKMRDEIDELRTSAKIFQVTKCTACTGPLDLPSVHFMCGHSYHHHCLGDERECLRCAPENKKIQDIIRAQEQSADHHEAFFKQMQAANDGFSVVADYYGRGVFNKMQLVGEPQARR
ncbi:hypothetical protein CAOG_01266 [Capsaspora owczarzaki ATCC 30864]|uniref:Uncharacterized protein n=1 Tax=Capsaspora owczarzaki (strain ATCC 30864) TaxID=595528 RepID=A0A0D2U3Q1_CAPO3|nr:hypothetical protein CAOG_01266 [Capsaspora owczarzaki ATCC 30864]KJE89841.1 hypothetical protein CAOG_001266 [Capsaspora owczarzaki ATCC 30864]|eukprot:XP_004349786.2 hypothetical protein CAOG_01266 [Capsaspora owczarzaki ATCC 30864]